MGLKCIVAELLPSVLMRSRKLSESCVSWQTEILVLEVVQLK